MTDTVKIELEVSQDVYQHLLVVVKNANLNDPDGTTHGKLDVQSLLVMAAEDLAMTNSRPGSWEGSNMQQVLDGHGYR